MNPEMNQEFGMYLDLVLGQALQAAGYIRNMNDIQENMGKFVYLKAPETEKEPRGKPHLYIEFQNLTYISSEWAPNAASRFTVFLGRQDDEDSQGKSPVESSTRCMLSELVVREFSVSILPTETHWWLYQEPTEMCQALSEAGHLLVGYGIPWLAEELKPPL